MNKKSLAKLYREMNSKTLTVNESIKEIDIFLETLEEALLIDGEVKFTKVGVFEILIRKPRVIANPITKELMTIYPKKTVKFRISKKNEITK
ncbi:MULTISPECIES: HU family DNA-binding protein [Fusobacterium]|uniref:HU family DNA-binding protein n=1 Tax=Fusobacterium TaxID=848 RepID=UPI00103032D2|nr:HU family DNA-binding protein [Fusobacterium ulcerans]